MTEDERWAAIVAADDEFLLGGAMLSEWCALIVRSADIAYASGAFLPAILAATAGIEAHLRWESGRLAASGLRRLIDESGLEQGHVRELHELRQYRNRWVHVDSVADDGPLLANADGYEDELEVMALRAMRLLRKTIYANPFL